jgi:phenylacetate-CoA ligase
VRAFGGSVRWQELYGSSEVGGPTLGWSPPAEPDSSRLLVDTDEFVVELLHPDRDEPVRVDEVGEITLTTPYRECAPLLRYRTRDLARATPGDDDPSGFPSISTLIGRVDDALKIRGALVYPAVIESVIVEHCADGAEWRIALDRSAGHLDTLRIVVEHERPDADGLATLVQQRLSVTPVVEVVAPGSLPRFEAKASRVVDRR